MSKENKGILIDKRDVNNAELAEDARYLAVVAANGKRYMALQTKGDACVYTWADPIVAEIPSNWGMKRLMSSWHGTFEATWTVVAHGYCDGCPIVLDDDEAKKVVDAIKGAAK